MSTQNKLVRMANQIADNFNFGNRDKAVAGIVDHITRFWTLEMKQRIVSQVKSGADLGLNELAAEALEIVAADGRYAT